MFGTLFSQRNFSESAQSLRQLLVRDIQSYDMSLILGTSLEEISKYFEKKYRMNPPILRIDEKYSKDNPQEIVKQNRNGYNSTYIQFTVCIPFDGDGNLLRLIPSGFTHRWGREINASIDGNEIHLFYEILGDCGNSNLSGLYEEDLKLIETNIESLKNEIEVFNSNLSGLIKAELNERNRIAGNNQSIMKSINLPIKKRGDIPTTYNIPAIRKKPTIIEKFGVKVFKPEPTLADNEYENILNIIKDMALAMERSPKTFIQLDEPDIRNIFLISLNGHYEGNATGETFNGIGKTDILIRHNNVNAFIAECKFWKGAKVMVETVDQLLGYVTWRDAKTAILLFNTQPNLSAVIDKAREALKTHPNYKSEYQLKMPSLKNNQTIFGYKFKHPSDQEKEVYLTLMAFQINAPSKDDNANQIK